LVVIPELPRIGHIARPLEVKWREGAALLARLPPVSPYGISTLSPMLDHLHVALRGDHRQSPLEIALAFQNNLAYLLGEALWTENFYVGTFSEYSMRAVRRAS
jgi:REP element-mobilizing transposase RayT